MLDDHEVVFANNCPVESFYFGPMSAGILDEGQLSELKSIFPDLGLKQQKLRHPVMKAKDAIPLAAQVIGNGQNSRNDCAPDQASIAPSQS